MLRTHPECPCTSVRRVRMSVCNEYVPAVSCRVVYTYLRLHYNVFAVRATRTFYYFVLFSRLLLFFLLLYSSIKKMAVIGHSQWLYNNH